MKGWGMNHSPAHPPSMDQETSGMNCFGLTSSGSDPCEYQLPPFGHLQFARRFGASHLHADRVVARG